MTRGSIALLGAVLAMAAMPAAAQEQAAASPAAAIAPVVLPLSGPVGDFEIPNPTTVKMPVLEFAPTPVIETDFDKYFYFHRAETSFVEAYGDIRECDALSSGANIYMGDNSAAMGAAMAQYGVLAGGVGGAIGSAIADAIFGSAARRQQRRINLRNCMGFKGYQRFGLSGDLWKEFNFEEGHGRKREGVRDEALEQQALVASGPTPNAKELGL